MSKDSGTAPGTSKEKEALQLDQRSLATIIDGVVSKLRSQPGGSGSITADGGKLVSDL